MMIRIDRRQSALFFRIAFSFLLVFAVRPASAIEVAFEKDSRLPLIYFNLAVKKAGAVTDPDQQEGLTNFMGEMLLRGTKAHTREQIDLLLDQMGAQLNVETRAESLIIRGAVLSSQLDQFQALVTEIVTEPSFPESEIRKLKSEVASLLQEELGHDGSLAARGFNRFLFQSHPYGKPILGKTKSIEHLKRSDIIAHYHRLFNEQTLLAVGYGDSTAETISKWTDELVSKLTKKQQNEGPIPTVPPPADADHRRLLIIDKPERTQTQINLGQVGIKMTDPDFFPIHLGNYVFGGPSFSAILMVEVRVKRGWSYGANSHFRYGLQPRSWQIHLFPAAKDTPNALGLSLELAEALKGKGVPADKFEFSKRSLVNNAGFTYNTPKKRVENILLERSLNLPDGFMKTFGPEIEKVKLEDVNTALKNFVKPDRMAIVVLGTAKDLKEPLAKAAGIPVESVEVVPYTEEN